MDPQGNNGKVMERPHGGGEAGETVRYQAAWTPAGHGYTHLTTDGRITLCGRPVHSSEDREPTAYDERRLCGICRKSRAAGSSSPREARRSRLARSGPAAAPRTPLEEKVAELERLAKEIAEIDDSRKAKVKRAEDLKGEISRFLASVTLPGS